MIKVVVQSPPAKYRVTTIAPHSFKVIRSTPDEPRINKVVITQTILQGPKGAKGDPGDGSATPSLRTPVTYVQNKIAEIADKDKRVNLNGVIQEVTYTIDPALFENCLWPVRCSNNNNRCFIEVSSGAIETINGDQQIMELLYRETVWLYSNGLNVEIL